MTKLVNRAKMTTATTGTGTITLGSAADGYQTFAAAGVNDADAVRYVIEDGDAWEIGTGTFDATGGTLTRTPSESSIGGGAITLSGNAAVFVTAAGQDIVQLDLAQTLTNKTISGTSNTVLNISRIFTPTVTGSGGTSDWTGSDPSTATITVSGLLSTDVPIVDIDLSAVLFANVTTVQTDWALVYRVEASADNTLKLYATAEPAQNFDLIVKVVR